jgi:integrase
MARRSKPERVLGPYRHYNRWRVLLVAAGGEKTVTDYEKEEEARQVVRSLRRELARAGRLPMTEALEKYEKYMREDKGNKSRSIEATTWRLGIFFSEEDLSVDELTPARCKTYYEDLRTRPRPMTKRPLAVDSHRNILAEAKSFLKWCVGKRWLVRNPLDEVTGVGRRRHGKAQLRIDEARRWQVKALEFADKGEAGAVAAMMSLVMGMRASEIVSRIVRDLDDDGQLLWIPETKTEAGKRTLPVPEFLQPYLRDIAEGKKSTDLLFGRHWRDWPREWVQRICKVAKVPQVTAHGMRGLHGTLAVERGATTHVVAQALGHESETTSRESYISREAITGADQRRVLGVLAGATGRRRSPRNNRRLTPRRGNDSPNFITAEPCVVRNLNNIVELNGIEPSAS